MSKFYNYDTRGASDSSQIIWLEDRLSKLEEKLSELYTLLKDLDEDIDNDFIRAPLRRRIQAALKERY